MDPLRRTRLRRIACAIAFLALYTLLHEGGHALAVTLLGGQVTTFDINFLDGGAHISYHGAFPPAQAALVSLAGPLLPVLAWGVFMVGVGRQGRLLLDWVRLVSLVGVSCSMASWGVIPVLDLRGLAPGGDDCTKFLRASGLPPLLVALGVVGVVAACWGLARWRMGPLRPWLGGLRCREA